VSAALSAGFMTVFVIVGGISRLFTDWLNQNAKYLALLIGVALVILGIAMLFGYRLPFSTPKLETGKRDQTIASMYVFGLAYAIASIGCTIGPFSATVLGTIDTDGFFQGVVAIALYGIAMSLLITTLTVTLALAQGGLLKSLRTGMTYVETASAVVMILSGLYLSWYWFNDIRDKYDDDLTGRVLNWQEQIAQYIDNNRLVLAIIFAVIVGSAMTYTFVSRRRDLERSS
jgi:cytochrome c biogenesis protein CcdA